MHFIPDGFHSPTGHIHCHHTITGMEVLKEGLYSLLVHQIAPLERGKEKEERGGREGGREKGRGRKKGREGEREGGREKGREGREGEKRKGERKGEKRKGETE